MPHIETPITRATVNIDAKQRTRWYVRFAILIIIINLCQVACMALDIPVSIHNLNDRRVEGASASYYHGRMYVEGIVRPKSVRSGHRVYVHVEVEDAAGKVIATKTGYGDETGRPQTIVQDGVPYVVSFRANQIKRVARIDIYY